MKRTYQPKNKKRVRKFGFMARNKTKAGKRVLKSRRRKGRNSLSVTEDYKLKRKKPTKHIR
jgi:large subunit ribosomal protein L34